MFTVRWELIFNYCLLELLSKYFPYDVMCGVYTGEDFWLENVKRDHIQDLGVDGG